MKKIAGRVVLILLLFAAIVGGIAGYDYIKGNKKESYEVMKSATLPLVQLEGSDGAVTELHGYVTEMQLSTMRDAITPLSSEHKLGVTLEYASAVESMSYEVRSLDGTRLVEDGDVEISEAVDGSKSAGLQFSSLVDNGNEYQLMLKLNVDGKAVFYYGRIIYIAASNTANLLSFPVDFINASINGDAAFIVNYIQPNDTMSTTDYGFVSNHSRSSMLTWGSLNVQLAGDIKTEVTELSSSQASMTVTYPVTLEYQSETKTCNVTEYYVVRYRDGVLYLLDFERHTKEEFSTSRIQLDDGNIWLGITDESPSKMDSADGTVHAYIYDRQLWCYDDDQSLMAPIYTYTDGDDERGSWNHHELRLVRVNDDGSIYFMVYGYHNRGNHEGEVGVSFCRYSIDSNTVDELFYIPVDFSEQVLEQNMGTIAYVSDDSDLLYLLYGSTVYSIDLASGEKLELAVAESAGSFLSNEDNSLIGWQEGDQDFPDKIKAVDLRTAKTYEIDAQSGEYLQIQGFIGRDLIYGIARTEEALTQAGDIVQKPMYRLEIAQFSDGVESVGEYEQSGMLITGTEISENEVIVSRAIADGDSLQAQSEDHIFLNDRDSETDTSVIRTKQLEGFLRSACIKTQIDNGELKSPPQRSSIRAFDSSYVLELDASLFGENTYFVFSRGGLSAIETKLSRAIQKAYDEMGVVVNGSADYIWTRGTRPLSKTVTVEELTCASAAESLETCIDILVGAEGGTSDGIASKLEEGTAPPEVIKEAMSGEGSTLELRGCTVGQTLYYLSLGHPVLAIVDNDRAVLITGYDSRNITIYDPFGELSGQMTQEAANEYFTQHDNNFICYID